MDKVLSGVNPPQQIGVGVAIVMLIQALRLLKSRARIVDGFQRIHKATPCISDIGVVDGLLGPVHQLLNIPCAWEHALCHRSDRENLDA